ncbi:AraC family transcriptional regulator [Lewinella sp. JB7]|uniref:helix-turn-helix domain-containing protein n=1 Tax=Lewinella sp. JB7 TaxID=2962887 RepID=UPI0020C9F189|nr:AraC family transcriptional regulator [Lewinella sp. JB7]MCP9234685.1 AraC family transcriptional regulator [Lewinella sp. JB7]
MFQFNLYSSLLLLGTVQALVYAILLLARARRESRISELFAGHILLTGGLLISQWMLGFAGWYDSHDWRTTLMFYVKWNNLALLGPLIWLYFRSTTNTDFRWSPRYWVHFLPWLILLLPYLAAFAYDVGYYRVFSGRAFTYFHGTRGPAQEFLHGQLGWYDTLETAVVWVQLAFYLFVTIRGYRLYRQYLNREFSNPTPAELRGLRLTLYLFVIGLGGLFLLQVALAGLTEGTYIHQWFYYFGLSGLMYLAAIQFYATDPAALGALRFDSAGGRHQESKNKEEDYRELLRQLDSRMRVHRDYLEPNLRLGEVAERIGTNAADLSRAVNSSLGKNFNDYVNTFRCGEFTEKLRRGEHERHTFLSLALDSGFNSKSTFNRAFRKCYGYSPGEAIRRLKSESDPSQIIS